MLDQFDAALLNLLQHDDSRTADELAREVPLSPSAIARRLRRLRGEGWIARTVALLSPRLMERRLRAIVTVQLSEHADQRGKTALLDRIRAARQVQLCYELAGVFDLLLLFDCGDMAESPVPRTGWALYFFAAIQRSIFCSRICSGRAPVSSTCVWNSRMSNRSPSSRSAFARSLWIVSAPTL